MDARIAVSQVSLVALGALLVTAACDAQAQAPAQVDDAPEHEEKADEIIVQATRSQRRVQDEPIRVEVIPREEIEEKAIMRPGAIAMLVSETAGVRVQVTSPALGAANIRIQGLTGRYTQLLTDGLPLYGGQSLGLLQIPPTDLGQVEVIKGAASALYGGSALGGVINLVSRRPGEDAEAETLFNLTTRNGQDYTAYAAAPLTAGFSGSITGGYHRQLRHDLDDDGWIDIPEHERWTARPRLFWEGARGAEAYLTLGAMEERRVGGTLSGSTTPDGLPFPQTQETSRFDAGLTATIPIDGLGMLNLRNAAMRQDHDHRFGAVLETDRHESFLSEASLSGRTGGASWVAGVAYQEDAFRSETFPQFDYSYRVPGAFAQVEQDVGADLVLAASARYDDHSEYGVQFSPRLSALYRPGLWTIRASVGQGYFAPTPFVEEIDAAGLSRLEALQGLEAETATTASLDVGWARGPLEWSATLFGADLDDVTQLVTTAPDRVRLNNVDGTTRVRGSELLLRYCMGDYKLTGSYVFIDATEPDPAGAGRRDVPLTPRHSGGVVAMWEQHGRGRLGIEAYYTGQQALDDNPYRTEGRPYVHLGVLGEITLGRASLFFNAENILDVRQTDDDSLLLPQRAADGRWTVDAWAPTDGFIFNAGVRLRFGGA